MDLIPKCIDDHPRARVHANEIVEQLSGMVLQFPASFVNRLEMLRCIEADKQEMERQGKKAKEIDQLEVAHSIDVEQLQLQIKDVNTQNLIQLIKDENEAKVKELKDQLAAEDIEASKKIDSLQNIISIRDAKITANSSEIEAKIRALQEKNAVISGMSEQLTKAREYLATKQQVSSDYFWNDNHANILQEILFII